MVLPLKLCGVARKLEADNVAQTFQGEKFSFWGFLHARISLLKNSLAVDSLRPGTLMMFMVRGDGATQ